MSRTSAATGLTRIHVGTSGWQYGHWRGRYYPEGVPKRCWLEHYASDFDCVEVNGTFYRLPDPGVLEKWCESTPEDFRFAVKASRYLTHQKKLKDPGDALARFVERIETLGEKLGPILFQLPPNWGFDAERLGSFLSLLPEGHDYALEPRDASWHVEECFALLREHRVAFCIHDLAGTLSPKECTAELVYVRLHGPGPGAYTGNYGTQALSGWAGAISTWRAGGARVHVYFDNDEQGYAAQNALVPCRRNSVEMSSWRRAERKERGRSQIRRSVEGARRSDRRCICDDISGELLRQGTSAAPHARGLRAVQRAHRGCAGAQRPESLWRNSSSCGKRRSPSSQISRALSSLPCTL